MYFPPPQLPPPPPNTPNTQCGPHLLWELHPDTAVLRTGHVTYMMSLPDGVTFYRVILGASMFIGWVVQLCAGRVGGCWKHMRHMHHIHTRCTSMYTYSYTPRIHNHPYTPTDTQPEVLGALEGVLEASTVYAESERLLTNDKVNPHEAAAAAKV